jgi:hypothetical protein
MRRNVKVIQHIHGKEHITDKLQTKSLEFTYEFIGICLFSKKNSVTFDSKPPLSHDWHNQHAIYLTRLKTQYLKEGLVLRYSQNLKSAFLFAKT